MNVNGQEHLKQKGAAVSCVDSLVVAAPSGEINLDFLLWNELHLPDFQSK